MKPSNLLLLTALLGLSAVAASATAPPVGSGKSTPLFDGKTLEGWETRSPELWRVEDGCITGGNGQKIPHNDFVCTKKSYSNFILRLKIKLTGDPATGLINSGVQIRTQRNPEGHEVCGYQCDYGEPNWYAGIYDEGRRNKFIAPADMAVVHPAVKLWDWNEYIIKAEGNRIQTWINGVPGVDYLEEDPNIPQDGIIGVQVHGGGNTKVQLKDITLEELPATPNAPTWEILGGVEGVRGKLNLKPKAKPVEAAKPARRDTSYNDVKGIPLTAEEEQKKFHLPEGYEIELVAKESDGIGKFVSVYFDQRGRLWTQTALEYPVDANENPASAEAVYTGKGKDKVLVYPREALNAQLPAGGLTNPTVFADGLAIPLGILPWGNGDSAYVLHGHDILLLKDTDGDGRADKQEVVLTGFGVQDSHLFPHQFTRAPGGWIWMAQGLFNNSKVHKPGSDQVVDWPKCGMARMRPDGSQFEVTSVGPNNIWGLVITGEGETFIQEANDYGYPVMPFHEYAYYPGGMESYRKSYQPEMPPQAEFRMGGTGLSGLALGEGDFSKLAPGLTNDGLCMFVANPIISKVQTIAMHRNGAHWKLEQAGDLITCDDPFFRPVGMTNGPDGCLYITDWYNKIISHNEVPRAHPDRDKTRGRIWRVKPRSVVPALAGQKATGPAEAGTTKQIPDFTKLGSEDLIALLGTRPTARAHIAWQTLADRGLAPLPDALRLHWAFLAEPNSSSFEKIRATGRRLASTQLEGVALLLAFAKPSLPGPTTQSSRGPKQIPVGEAYDREFERYLVRMFLERHPDIVAKFLDTDEAAKLPVEARVLASLALEPKTSASRVARLLPQLDRAPNQEELLRLAQFPDEAGCGDALKALLSKPESRAPVAEKLLAQKTNLDPNKIAPLLNDAAKALLGSNDNERVLGVSLIGGFQLASLENDLVTMVRQKTNVLPALQALRELHGSASEVFAELANSTDPMIRDEALGALASSKNPNAAERLLALYPTLDTAQQRAALNALSSSKTGAKAIVAALTANRLPKTDLDGPAAERLSIVLGNDPELAKLMQSLGHVFHHVLALDGSDNAWADSRITLDGPFTMECWLRLAPGIGNEDDILGVPGGVEMNFFQSKFRVFAGPALHDVVVAKKPMTPDLWTHIAVSRDANGICRIYQNGELDAEAQVPAPAKWENCRIGWSGPKKGTEGAITEFRVWNHERTAQEIRANFDRVIESTGDMKRFDDNWGQLEKGARIARTTDYPPILNKEQADKLDKQFAHYSELGHRSGNLERGKMLSAICQACHTIGAAGGQIGPNLSGAGAMGLEGVLRNIMTPNAAMEAGYRIFRVELKTGDIIDAFFVSEDKQAIVIRQPGLQDRRIPKKDVRSTRYIRRSLMPEGLLDALNDEQVTDLLSYLMTLKG